MKRLIGTALGALMALSACSGGIGSLGSGAGMGAPPVASGAGLKKKRLVKLVVRFAFPRHRRRRAFGRFAPEYISASSESIAITLNTVNGSSPPAGLTAQVITNLTFSGGSPTCTGSPASCTVLGPSVPPGTDSLSLVIYDRRQTVNSCPCAGNILSEKTQNFTVTPGQTNALSVALEGVPASFSFGGTLGGGTGGTAFTNRPLTVSVDDADGNLITGTYFNPVTVTDGEADGLGATNLSVNGGSTASSVLVHASTDSVDLNYSGLAIAPVHFSASASGATTFDQTFSTSNANPSSVCSDGGADICATTPTNPTVDLYTTSGTGSTATLTATQPGWTNTGFVRDVGESDTCGSFATISLTKSTSSNGGNGSIYTATALNTASTAGTCTITFKGGDPANHSEAVTLTFTTSSIGVNVRRRP
jgi:hypothetical protein